MVGTTISHYKVLEKIGEGGIVEVCRASGNDKVKVTRHDHAKVTHPG